MTSVLRKLCLGLFLISTVWTQETDLTLTKIYPCSGIYSETVSRFKSDIYAVIPSFRYCNFTTNIAGLRVFSSILSASNETVVFLSRQGTSDPTTWPIPFQPQGFEELFYSVSRTMCPIDSTELEDDDSLSSFLLYLDVFTTSLNEVEYQIKVDIVQQFVIELDESISVRVGAASPQVLYFKFPENVNRVSVEADADSDTCAILSIQKNNCPTNDLLRTTFSRGKFQTMSKFGYITVMANQMKNREFVIVLITANYTSCHKDDGPYTPPRNISDVDYDFYQNIKVTVRNADISKSEFAEAIAVPIISLLLASILSILFFVIWEIKYTRKLFNFNECRCCKIKMGPEQDDCGEKKDTMTNACIGDDIKITINELYKKNGEDLGKLYCHYFWNTATVGIFYSIPAVQWLFTQVESLNDDGDQDKCYFNFRCAFHLGEVISFNNLFSNAGYIILGVNFLIIVAIRQGVSRKRNEKNSSMGEYKDLEENEITKDKGVPKFYGLYYALGVALIMEGMMSLMYHVCPTNSNFQFDTSFMFIIGGLILAQIFQKRHPDIQANACIAFFCFAVVVCIALLSIKTDKHNKIATRVVMGIVILVIVIVFAFLFYNFYFCVEQENCSGMRETIKMNILQRRKIYQIGILIVLNIIVTIGTLLSMNITTCILVSFIVNVVTFILFYIFYKMRNQEYGTVYLVFVILLVTLFWIAALFYFQLLKETNSDAILVLDDDVEDRPTDKLRVF